jgi:enterochelin esterase-like enzyme
VVRLAHDSRALRGNPWADPHERELCVYLPPGYSEAGAPHLALWDFAAFTNSGPGHLNWRNQGETLVQRLDRLIHEGLLPPVLVPMPDCYSTLGGNQYIDSEGVGRYAEYVLEELVPFVAERFNVRAGARGRGVFGKSSGGYGGLVQAMRHPGSWGAVAAHAPDVGFDWVYRPGFPDTCLVLEEYGGDPRRFLEVFWGKRIPAGRDFGALLTVAMAATYDPDPRQPGRIRLPFDVHTCALDEERWARWLAHDPLQLLDSHADGLRQLEGLWLDVGGRDQYHIQFGLRAFSAELEKRAIDHHFEEFNGTHSHLDWRLDHSLPYLARALQTENNEHETRDGQGA